MLCDSMMFGVLALLSFVGYLDALTDACTMLPFDNYDDLSCNVEGWYNDTTLPCNTYKAANEVDESFLYVPLGKTVTVTCDYRRLMVGGGEYRCTDQGFVPPIKITDEVLWIDPHPTCIETYLISSKMICDTSTLSRDYPHFELANNADYIIAGKKYRVSCEAGYATHTTYKGIMLGSCIEGEWAVAGSNCLAKCKPEVIYEGGSPNTAVIYENYSAMVLVTDLGMNLHDPGTEVNMTISCNPGYSPTGVRSEEFQLTCTSQPGLKEGYYAHARKVADVNCKRICTVPSMPRGRLVDRHTGLTLTPSTLTMMNGEDSARLICPYSTYGLGRVRMKCYDGEIPHDLPVCQDEFEPCESPEVDGGVRDPHNIAPGNTYTLECQPGRAIRVLASSVIECNKKGSRGSELFPPGPYTCYEGCPMPFRSMTSGTLSPEPSLSEAPYKLGEVISIECHNGDSSQHLCQYDGWDHEEWAICAPIVSSCVKTPSSLAFILLCVSFFTVQNFIF